MQIHITPRNITLTGAIHEFVAEKVSHLEGHGETILAAHIVLLHNHDRKKPYIVKVHLALSGPDIHAEDAEADLYVAIDKVIDKLSRQISKLKTKKKERDKHRIQQTREAEKRGYKRP
jgi:putative sigma-54 modulation protein